MTRHWFPASLRLRLTMWSVAAMVVVLVVYATIVFALVRRNVSQGLDDRLQGDFWWATEMAEQRPDGSLRWFEGASENDFSPWLQVWTPAGELIYRTERALRLPVPGSADLAARPDARIAVLPTEHAPVRILSGPATIGGRPVVIQVGASEELMRSEMRELLLVLWLGLPIGIAVAGAAAYTLVRGALTPLERMAQRARAITAARLSDRLPIDNPHDELGRLAAVFNDTLERLEASFEQMRRFSADVSHELRTPLTALQNVGEVSLRDHHDEAGYRTVIASMLEETNRLTCLIERLLTMSRADSGELKLAFDTVDLGVLAEDVTAYLGALAEDKQQGLRVEAAPDVRCPGDELVLRQALINLVENAIKYTPAGGDIVVRVGAAAGQAVLEVSDTGPGIPEGQETRIFDRFYRGGRADERRGTGLGLALARWAVQAHLGELSYRPVETGGSTFRIALPVPDVAEGGTGASVTSPGARRRQPPVSSGPAVTVGGGRGH